MVSYGVLLTIRPRFAGGGRAGEVCATSALRALKEIEPTSPKKATKTRNVRGGVLLWGYFEELHICRDCPKGPSGEKLDTRRPKKSKFWAPLGEGYVSRMFLLTGPSLPRKKNFPPEQCSPLPPHWCNHDGSGLTRPPPSQTHSSQPVEAMSLASCETNTTPPLYSWMPLMSASTLSMSLREKTFIGGR